MRTIVSFLLCLLFSLHSFCQELDTTTLTIEFEILKHNKGSILLALYDSELSYMKKAYISEIKDVKNNKAIFILKDIKKKTYSFSYFHDVNGNKKLDKNFLGIPKEPYGFSNNQKGKFGPPSFQDAAITLDKDTVIKIRIK